LKGSNFFLNNGSYGLRVYSFGAITVNNVTAANNGHSVDDGVGSGVYLSNYGALTTKPRTSR